MKPLSHDRIASSRIHKLTFVRSRTVRFLLFNVSRHFQAMLHRRFTSLSYLNIREQHVIEEYKRENLSTYKNLVKFTTTTFRYNSEERIKWSEKLRRRLLWTIFDTRTSLVLHPSSQ